MQTFLLLQRKSLVRQRHEFAVRAATAEAPVQRFQKAHKASGPDPNVLYDAVIVGGGMGGLTTASQMAAKGAKVLVLEK